MAALLIVCAFAASSGTGCFAAMAAETGTAANEPVDTETSTEDVSYKNAENGNLFNVSCRTDHTYYISQVSGKYPLVISVKNKSDKDFSGVVKLMLPYQGGYTKTIALAKDISVEAGQTKDIDFAVNLTYLNYLGLGNDISFRVDILDVSGNPAFKSVFVIKSEADTYTGSSSLVTGLISDSAEKYKGETNFPLNYTDPNQAAETEAESSAETDSADSAAGKSSISSNYSYYSGLSVFSAADASKCDLDAYTILIDESMPDASGWKNISEWTVNGGYLLLNRKTASQYLPEDKNKTNTFRYGAGKILIYDQSGKETLNDYSQLCSELMTTDEYNNLGLAFYSSRDPASGLYSTLTDYDITDRAPAFFNYLFLIMIYILIICPGLYYFLKKRDRLEHIWFYVPVIAVIFSGVVYAAGSHTRLHSLSGEYFSSVQLSDEGSVQSTIIKTTEPGRNSDYYSLPLDYDVTYYMSGSGQLSAVDNALQGSSANDFNSEDLMKASYKAAIASTDDGTDIVTGRGSVFEENSVIAKRHTQSKGKIEASLTCWRAGISGTITNNTSYDINDVFILRKDLIYYIGEIDAGDTVTVKNIAGQLLADADFSSAGSSSCFITDLQKYDFANDNAGLKCMSVMIGSANNVLGDDTLIGGFSSSCDSGLDADQFDKLKGLTMLYNYVSIKQSAVNWKCIDPLWGIPVTEDDVSKYSYDGHFIYDDDLNLLYKLDSDMNADHLVWINPQKHLLKLSLYNWSEEKYETVMADSETLSGQSLKKYINSRNQILVNIKYKSEDTATKNGFYIIPAFDVSGGDRND